MEAHLGKSRIAQRLLPELRRCRVLRPDAEAVAGQVLRDAPPSADSLGGERGHLLAQDGTIAPAPAAAEHHVRDDQAAARTQPLRRTRGQRPLVGISQVVQRVAADDEVGMKRRKPEVLIGLHPYSRVRTAGRCRSAGGRSARETASTTTRCASASPGTCPREPGGGGCRAGGDDRGDDHGGNPQPADGARRAGHLCRQPHRHGGDVRGTADGPAGEPDPLRGAGAGARRAAWPGS